MIRFLGRVNAFFERYPLVAYVCLTFGIALAFFRAESARDTSEREREARAAVQSEINRYVCQENNKQDTILADLLDISLNGSQTFGQDIDPSQLTEFDIAVLSSIGKVQELTQAGPPTEQEEVFQDALVKLRNKAPCNAIANAFLEAQDTEDIEAVRAILHTVDPDVDEGWTTDPRQNGQGQNDGGQNERTEPE